MKKNIILLAIIAALLVATALFIYIHKNIKSKAIPASLPIVTTIPITYHTSELTVKTYGATVSPTSMVVRAQSNAEIAAIYFKPGQLVKKGKLLFRLKLSDIGNQKQKLLAQMQQSKSLYLRLLHMNKKTPGIVASFDILKAKTQYQQDLATYNQLIELENIKAPIKGMVADTNYSIGDIVTTGTQLTQITDPNSLQVKYQLPTQYIKKTALGQAIRFYPDGTTHVYLGKISYISPQFESNSYSLTIRADLYHFKGLRPNHFGQVIQVINPHYKTLAIPQNLVHNDSQGFYVYVLKNNRVNKRYFKPGNISKAGLIQVLSGIKANTQTINSNQSVISQGQIVRVDS